MTHEVAELEQLVRGLADHPELWRDEVHHDPAERTFARLVRTDSLEVWLVNWMAGHDTGFHDHDDAGAAIAVVEGRVVDERLALGGPALVSEHGPGEVITVAPGGIHRVQHAGQAPTVTLHAYSPPLGRMGTYAVGDEGRLLRMPQDGEQELRAPAR